MEEKKVTLSEAEAKVIEMMRNLKYGELVIVMKDGKAIRVEEKKSISL